MHFYHDYYSERRGASRSREFFPQRDISKNIEVFGIAYGTFFFVFDRLIDIRDETGQSDST